MPQLTAGSYASSMCVTYLTTQPELPLMESGISIILLFTFFQPVFYATYDQNFPSESEETAGYWVGFGEHCGDAMTHKILHQYTQKIIYRSAVRPKKSSTPNHRLAPHGGEVSASSDPSEDKISSGSPIG